MSDNKLIDNLDNENIPVFSVSEITTEITNLLEKKYNYIKCLNDNILHLKMLSSLIQEHTKSWPENKI